MSYRHPEPAGGALWLVPWVTFAVNVLGDAAFGLLPAVIEQREAVDPTGRTCLLTGVLGERHYVLDLRLRKRRDAACRQLGHLALNVPG